MYQSIIISHCINFIFILANYHILEIIVYYLNMSKQFPGALFYPLL